VGLLAQIVLLLEPQRTNLNTFSDGFTNGWTASGGTITATANYGISPDGYQNSTRIQFAAANLIWRKSVVNQALLFPTRLSNADLAALTA
jgi:hypothetical protein